MAKITRAHIIAARGRKRILESQKKAVPEKITKLAGLDPAKFPREASARREGGRHLPGEARSSLTFGKSGITTVSQQPAGEVVKEALEFARATAQPRR